MKRERLSTFNPAENQRPFSLILPFDGKGGGFTIDQRILLSASLKKVEESLRNRVIKTLYITTKGFVLIVSEKSRFVLNENCDSEETREEVKTFSVNVTTGKNRIILIGNNYRVEHLGRYETGEMVFKIESYSPLKVENVSRSTLEQYKSTPGTHFKIPNTLSG